MLHKRSVPPPACHSTPPTERQLEQSFNKAAAPAQLQQSESASEEQGCNRGPSDTAKLEESESFKSASEERHIPASSSARQEPAGEEQPQPQQHNKKKSAKKALKSMAPVKEALAKALPASSLVKALPTRSLVTGVFSFLRQTGFDKVAQAAFLVFQAAPSDVSSWMFGDSVMLRDVYYRCVFTRVLQVRLYTCIMGCERPRPLMQYVVVVFMQ
jgi:hypothetical protein